VPGGKLTKEEYLKIKEAYSKSKKESSPKA
jgi:hypothetical protein